MPITSPTVTAPTNSSQSDTLKVKSPILSLPTIVVGIFVGIEYHLLVFISFSSIQYSLSVWKFLWYTMENFWEWESPTKIWRKN